MLRTIKFACTVSLLCAALGSCAMTPPPEQVSSGLIAASTTLTPEECLKRTEDFIKGKYNLEVNEDVLLDRTKEPPFSGLRLRTNPKLGHGYQIKILFGYGESQSSAKESVALVYFYAYRGTPPVWVEADWDLESSVADIKQFINNLP